jgi:ankyrin repeat protein
MSSQPVAKRSRNEKPEQTGLPSNLDALDKVSRLATLWQLNAVQPLVPQLKFGQVVREVRQWLGCGWFQLACCSKAFSGAYVLCMKVNTLYRDRLAHEYCRALVVMDQRRTPPAIPERLLSESRRLLRRIENHTQGYTDLMRAAQANQVDTTERLLDLGADVRAVSWDGCTPLMEAVRHSGEPVVRLLLDARSDPNGVDRLGHCVLHQALGRNKTPVVQLLLDRGANPNLAGNGGGSTPLISAASKNDGQGVRLLLAAKAEINRTNRGGWTALMGAAFGAQTDALKELLAHKADPNVVCPDVAYPNGMSALSLAITRGWLDTVRLLLEGGADPRLGQGAWPLLDDGVKSAQIALLLKSYTK